MALVSRSRVVALLTALTVAGGTGSPDAAPPSEYEVKAACIYNFAKFVEWPAAAQPRDGDEFVITILGEDPFGGLLEETLRGKAVGQRRITVRRAVRAADLGRSQILFVSDSEAGRLSEVLASLEGTAVLTVGEMDQFAERGGIIRLRTDRSRVRIDINVATAERAGLKISSELLKLARIVGRRAGG
jgi:hypothetical protein